MRTDSSGGEIGLSKRIVKDGNLRDKEKDGEGVVEEDYAAKTKGQRERER